MTTHTGAGKLAGSAAASISSASMPPAEPPMTTIRCVDTRLRCHIRKVRARFGRHRMVGAATHPQCTSHLVTRWISPLARRTLGSKVSVRRLSQSIRRQRRARLVMSAPAHASQWPASWTAVSSRVHTQDSRRRAHWFMGATLYGSVRGRQSGRDLPAASMLLKRRSACSQTARDKGNGMGDRGGKKDKIRISSSSRRSRRTRAKRGWTRRRPSHWPQTPRRNQPTG